MSNKPMNSAFTLIELLVVMAIIAILAALGVGQFNRAIESAHRAKCSSNLKQLTTAIFTYAADNNGRLPGPVFRSIRDPSVATVSYLSHSNWFGPYLGNAPNGSVWRCPANDAAFNANAGKLVYILNNQNTTDPKKFFGDAQSSPKEAPRPLAAIRAAGQNKYAGTTARTDIWLISDIDGENFNSAVSGGGTYSLPTSLTAPHNGGRNYSFLDGHVEFRKRPKDANNLQPGEWPPNP